jgi:hypothetical protein
MRAFRRPGRFNKTFRPEALAGWVLVEEFDNERVRLKRPVNAREHDRSADLDPHQTQ